MIAPIPVRALSALHRSVVADPKTASATVSISAKIYTHRRFSLDAMRHEFKVACRDALEIAYPSPSPFACAKAASRATGIDRDLFYRVLRLETQAPDFAAIIAAIRVSNVDTDAGLRAYALLMQIMAVQQ